MADWRAGHEADTAEGRARAREKVAAKPAEWSGQPWSCRCGRGLRARA